MKATTVVSCSGYVVYCRHPGCLWRQHHGTAGSARQDGIAHEAERHAAADLRRVPGP